MSDLVLVEHHDAVAVVTLNRPQARNALSRALLAELAAAFTTLREAAAVRAVVLTGADPGFCAGVDLKEVAAGAAGGSAPGAGTPVTGTGSGQDAVTAMLEVGKPLVGAVNGVTVTGGLEVALACDFRVASERARFADTHARVGVMPGWGLTVRLPQAVGFGWARQMSFTGNYVDAALALRIGLVNEVVPHEELLPRALALAADAATVEPADLAGIRGMYRVTEAGTAADGFANEARVGAERGGFNPDEVARRRDAVFSRGRTQTGG